MPRRSFLLVSSANQRSTRFSHELQVGVKCRTNRGWAASQRWIAGVLWVEALSRIRCTSRSAGTARSRVVQELLELDRAVAGVQRADHLAGGEVQRGVQARGARALVVVRRALRRAGQHRQDRRRPIERLDLALLVDAQNDRPLGRIEVQPDDVADLVRRTAGPWTASTSPGDAAAARTPARSATPRSARARPRPPSTGSTNASRPAASTPASSRSPPRPARR